jgi:protein tyrosine phosphatase (PTP) superfamily phosphohydrolase (DUF442 family)
MNENNRDPMPRKPWLRQNSWRWVTLLVCMAATHFVVGQIPPSPEPFEVRPGIFVLQGVPDAATIGSLKALGITHILNLRKPPEGDSKNEMDAVQAMGAAYLSCPSHREPTDAEINTLRSHLKGLPKGAKAFVHCASGNRAGGMLFAYWVLDCQVPEREAFVLAHKAGLNNPATEAAVMSYLKAHQATLMPTM